MKPQHISSADWSDPTIHIAERDGPIVKDGQRVTRPMMMMDSVQRSTALTFADADAATLDPKADAYERRDKALNDAWRSPPPVAASAAPALITAPVIDTSQPNWREIMYAARDAALQTQWVNGGAA